MGSRRCSTRACIRAVGLCLIRRQCSSELTDPVGDCPRAGPVIRPRSFVDGTPLPDERTSGYKPKNRLAEEVMQDFVVSVDQALTLRDRGALCIDARSPAEYAEATIPGALNVPILDDAQRVEIGTLYKQAGRQAARRRGVEIVAPKIPALVEHVATARPAGSPPAVVFCWRGGMRSLALTQFLELAGVPARQVAGGHKAFRSLVRNFF